MKDIRNWKNFNFTKYCAFDTETTGFLKYEGDYIFAFSITNWYGETLVLRLDTKSKKKNIENRKVLQDFWNDTSIVKIIQNAKFDISFCKANGFNIPRSSIIHDTIILAQYMYNLHVSYKIEYLAYKYFKYPFDQDKALKTYKTAYTKQFNKDVKEGNHDDRLYRSGYHKIPVKIMDKYQIADTERTMLLYQLFAPELWKDKKAWNCYLNDVELLWTSMKMESNGILLDVIESEKLLKQLRRKLKTAQFKLNKIAGKEINCDSDKQVAELIYDKLGNRCIQFTKKGGRSTSKDVLMPLREKGKSPVYDLILRCRAFSGGVSTIETYKQLAHPVTGKLYHNINTNRAKTGRQSVNDPALQTVQKEVSVKTIYGIPARRCFRADHGFILFMVDYAGIELRLIVEAAQELEMIDIINSDGDVHDTASEEIYQDYWHIVNELIVSPNGVTLPKWIKEMNPKDYNEDYKNLRYKMRAGVKDFEFGGAYGGNFSAITKNLIGLTTKEKRQGAKRFAKRWPGIAKFTDNVIQEIKRTGYVTNVFGRKLYVERGKEYTGSNYIVQNLAAEIMKRAENRLDNYFQYEWDDQIKQIVTVHDEDIIAYPKKLITDLPEVYGQIEKLMTEFDEIKIKLEVEADVTETNWAAAKPFKIEEWIN